MSSKQKVKFTQAFSLHHGTVDIYKPGFIGQSQQKLLDLSIFGKSDKISREKKYIS